MRSWGPGQGYRGKEVCSGRRSKGSEIVDDEFRDGFFLFEISTVGRGILEDDSSGGERGNVGVSRRTVSKRRTTVMGTLMEG